MAQIIEETPQGDSRSELYHRIFDAREKREFEGLQRQVTLKVLSELEDFHRPPFTTMKAFTHQAQARYAGAVVKACDGNKPKAARILGVAERTLYDHLLVKLMALLACASIAVQGATVYVSTTGNDATAVRGDPTHPALTLTNANALALSGDTIQMGIGHFPLGPSTVNLKAGLTVVGAGRTLTDVDGAAGDMFLLLGSANLSNFSLSSTNRNGAANWPLESNFSTVPSVTVTMTNMDIHGYSDGISLFNTTNQITFNAVNSTFQTAYDAMILVSSNAASSFTINGCLLASSKDPTLFGTEMRTLILAAGPQVFVTGCFISASNATARTWTIWNTNSTLVVSNTVLMPFSGSGSVCAIKQEAPGSTTFWGPSPSPLCIDGGSFTPLSDVRHFYIDFENGNDSNAGTTRWFPWKRHPYMPGFTGTYAHQIGDQFIFKGGVTWPNACFTVNVQAGGNGVTPDYYGYDSTWYSGTSFSRPVFDAGGVELGGGYDVMILMNLIAAPHHITFDGFDMRNVFWTGPKSFSQVAYFNLSVSHDITISDCWMHNWTHGPLSNGTTDIMKIVVGSNSSPFNPGCLLSSCLIDGENVMNSSNGTSSGEGTFAYSGDVINTTVRNLSSGFIVTGDPANHTTPQIVRGCNIGPSLVSFDPGEHPDGLFMNGGNFFHWYNNFIHDCVGGEIVFAGNGGGNEDTYIFNNVIWNGNKAPVEIDTPYTGGRVWMYNNTLVGGSFSGVRVQTRGVGPLGVLDFRNNFIISDSTAVTIDPGATITHFTNANNVLLTTANASVNGFSAANRYAPQSINQATYNAGLDLSALIGGLISPDIVGVVRPQAVAWDVGAYEFASSASPGILSFLDATYSIQQNQSFVPVRAFRTGGVSGAVGVQVTTHDGSATAGVDYSALDVAFNWADGDTGPIISPVNLINAGATTNRVFTVVMHDAIGGAVIGSPSTMTVTITPIPQPPPQPTNAGTINMLETSHAVTLTDGTAGIGVFRGGSTNIGTSVSYTTVDGTAIAGVDYTATSGTLTWGVNVNSTQPILIPITNTGKHGSTPITFTVIISNPTNGATIGAAMTAISITLLPVLAAPTGLVISGNVDLQGPITLKFNP